MKMAKPLKRTVEKWRKEWKSGEKVKKSIKKKKTMIFCCRYGYVNWCHHIPIFFIQKMTNKKMQVQKLHINYKNQHKITHFHKCSAVRYQYSTSCRKTPIAAIAWGSKVQLRRFCHKPQGSAALQGSAPARRTHRKALQAPQKIFQAKCIKT